MTEQDPEQVQYVIANGWLCEAVNAHTCGTARGGYYGAHEPGCGLMPVARVDALLAEVEAGRALRERVSAHTDWHGVEGLLDRLDAAEAEHRDLTQRLGFGDNITEPMADNDTIVAWFEEQSRDANEWQESQLWRNDCYMKGHPELEDCWECDPALRLEAAERDAEAGRALRERVEALLADEWREEPPSATYPEGRTLYRWPGDLRLDLIAALNDTHITVDRHDQRVTHADEDAATRYALDRSREIGGEVAVVADGEDG